MNAKRAQRWREWLAPAGALVLGVAIGGWGWGSRSDSGAGGERNGAQEALRGKVRQVFEGGAAGDVGRMAEWLLEAEKRDLAAAWEVVSKVFELSSLLGELLVGRWVELDPEGAVAATSDDFGWARGWSVWGRVDPEAALEAAAKTSLEAEQAVVLGIAFDDPQRALAMRTARPELRSQSGDGVLTMSLARTDPREAALWARRNYNDVHYPVREWAKRDAEAAVRWYAASQFGRPDWFQLEHLARAIASEQSMAIEGIAAKVPAGDVRRALRRARVEWLAKRDREEALAEAWREEAPRTKRELFAVVGAALLPEDPQRSVALLEELLSEVGAPGRSTRTQYPDGGGSIPDPSFGWHEWMAGLAASVPEAAMDLLAKWREGPHGEDVQFAKRWMARDADGFANWLDRQPEGPVRDDYCGVLAEMLQSGADPDFEAAVLRLAKIQDPGRRKEQTISTMIRWCAQDLEAAKRFADSAAATREVKEGFRRGEMARGTNLQGRR